MGVIHSSLMFDFDLETGADEVRGNNGMSHPALVLKKGCLMKTAVNQFVSWQQV